MYIIYYFIFVFHGSDVMTDWDVTTVWRFGVPLDYSSILWFQMIIHIASQLAVVQLSVVAINELSDHQHPFYVSKRSVLQLTSGHGCTPPLDINAPPHPPVPCQTSKIFSGLLASFAQEKNRPCTKAEQKSECVWKKETKCHAFAQPKPVPMSRGKTPHSLETYNHYEKSLHI